MSKKTEFTSEQKLAIREEGNIIVSAGAGSGKTAVLSERVLYYIQNKGFKIDEFLILTFTRLASGEMKERIRKKLTENNLKDKDYVDTADITTFDAFSNSLVKKYHNYLNVDNDFTIIDSNIILVKKIKLIKKELEKLYQEQNRDFLDIIDRYCFKNDDVIENLVLQILNRLDLSLDKESYLNNFIDKYFSLKNIDNIIRELQNDLIGTIEESLNNVEIIPDVNLSNGGSFLEEISKSLSGLLKINEYDLLIKEASNLNIPRCKNGYKEDLDEEEIKVFENYRKQLREIKTSAQELLQKNEIIEQIQNNLPFAKILLRIVKTVENDIKEYKNKFQVYEFSDITKMAISLVKEYPEIRNQLKQKYKMIMIDEYQDTNDVQETFISYIQNNNVYCVGDIKQSIYAFRNAKCEIFKNKYELYKNSNLGKAIDLNKNFRSRKEVLDNINEIFKRMMTNDYGGANYLKEHVIEYGNLKYLDDVNPMQDNNLEVINYACEKNMDLEKEIRIVANDIINKINNNYQVLDMNHDKAKLRKCEFKDFAIIMDRGSDFEEYLRIFSEYQIPIFMEKDEDLKSNAIILLLTNLLIVIKYIFENIPLDDKFLHAFVSLCRSFIGNYNDDQIYVLCKSRNFNENEMYQTIKLTINNNRDCSKYLLMFKIIEELKIYEKLTRIGDVEKNHRYLDFFVDTFHQMQNLDYSYDDFIEYLQNLDEFNLKLNLSSKGTSINSVRLINIHKSKGLEFNIVYFPGLKHGFPKFESRKKVGLSDEYGLYLRNNEISMVQKAHKIHLQHEEISEKIRLFYVALTRAREKMIFVMPKIENYKEVAISKANSLFDLFYPVSYLFKTCLVEEIQNQKLNFINIENIGNKFEIKSIKIQDEKKISLNRASKDAIITIDKSALKFGEEIHFILEILDFKNPNLDFIKTPFIKKKVKAFLSSGLIENLSEAKIFKEYEFLDEINHTNGIIDLFIVYPTKVILIDYKTKNILDEKYDDQIKIYYNFLKEKYHKPIECYLYSLIDETTRQIKFRDC